MFGMAVKKMLGVGVVIVRFNHIGIILIVKSNFLVNLPLKL